MDYTRSNAAGQQIIEQKANYLWLPADLYGFQNTSTSIKQSDCGRTLYCFDGKLDLSEEDRVCIKCGHRMHIHKGEQQTLRHLPIGGGLSFVRYWRHQLICPYCGASKMQPVYFKAEGYRMTAALYQYARDMLARGTYTNKQVSEITGLGKNTVKSVDLNRLSEKYTIDGQKLIRPEEHARYLGIDEFKLHDGYRFATHIIDLETGHILWIEHGKKKQVVYDFIEHVGVEWMSYVKAVSCDMNSDFEEAFKEKCPHIAIVFDHFHIVKNFNEKVVAAVRKDEQKRLVDEGDVESAQALKRMRYILLSKRSTLMQKDEEARNGLTISKGSALFNKEEYVRREGYEVKYDELLRQNKLLFTADLVKEMLELSFSRDNRDDMIIDIARTAFICYETENPHFEWFGDLLTHHFEGIIAHADYPISNGKIEGINNKIKTLRRQGYGYPDDDYFFLKLIDMSRTTYVRNAKSHRNCD